MTSKHIELYRRARTIACAALNQALEVREEFVISQCGNDDALYQEVHWLIAAAEDPSEDTLTGKFQTAARPAVDEVCLEAPLPRNYRLIRRLDEGGMGVVYLAERIDGEIRHQVALKLLHLVYSADASMTRRFVAEHRILGELNHTNIAHLVDAGVTTEGRPFLAMEYVDGVRLDRWCDHNHMSLNERICIFLQVCAAVDHAHRHMIIHRDIKPANIMVTTDGVPKLLDFGIAKLLEDNDSVTQTKTSRRALTMAYASPEQVEGGPLTTATDVYSLGVVLYQLVAGAHPFEHLASAHLLPGAIASGDISPPSKHIHMSESKEEGVVPKNQTPPAERKSGVGRLLGKYHIPRDIDAIVLKALRHDPVHRYASVNDFAEDLKRYLSSRPVLARRGHWLYISHRFLWRHRWGVAVIMMLVSLLGAFMIDRETQLERTALERDRAQTVTVLLNDLFMNAESLPSRGNEVTVREMLDLGAQELLARENLDPEIRAHVLLTLGRAYNALSMGEKARPLLESALAATSTANRSSLSPEILAALTRAYGSSGNSEEAIKSAAKAIDLFKQSPGNYFEEIVELKLMRLHNHINLMDVPLVEVVSEVNYILKMLEESQPEPPPTLLFLAHFTTFTAYSYMGRTEEAFQSAKNILTIGSQLYQNRDPRAIRYRLAYSTATMNSDPEKSIELFEALISDLSELVGPSLTLANVYSSYGVALSMVGRHEGSLSAHITASRIARASGGDMHQMQGINNNLANAYLSSGQLYEAREVLENRMPFLSWDVATVSGVELFDYAVCHAIYARVLLELEELEKAEKSFAKAAKAFKSVDIGAWPSIRRQILSGLTSTRLELGLYSKAEESLNQLKELNDLKGLTATHEVEQLAAQLRLRTLSANNRDANVLQLSPRILSDACKPDNMSDSILEVVRAPWVDSIELLAYEAPLMKCGAPSIVRAPTDHGTYE